MERQTNGDFYTFEKADPLTDTMFVQQEDRSKVALVITITDWRRESVLKAGRMFEKSGEVIPD